jgi:diacylglycerol kinase (ATP)
VSATRPSRPPSERRAPDPQPEPARRPLSPAAREPDTSARPHRTATPLIQSFNYAFEGVIWTLRSQRNMRIHFAVATVVLVLAFAYDVTKLELIALLLAISFVLVAEMVNTAIESVTDIATTSYNPLAKLAKDIAAGAVLVASVTAGVIGYLVLADRLSDPSNRVLVRLRDAPLHLTVIALVVAVLVVIAVKALTHRGTPLRGGLPSGHAALAFAGWAAVTFVTEGYDHRVLVSTVVFVLALLVAHTRVESGIHSTTEVALGSVLGAGTTLALFQAFG